LLEEEAEGSFPSKPNSQQINHTEEQKNNERTREFGAVAQKDNTTARPCEQTNKQTNKQTINQATIYDRQRL